MSPVRPRRTKPARRPTSTRATDEPAQFSPAVRRAVCRADGVLRRMGRGPVPARAGPRVCGGRRGITRGRGGARRLRGGVPTQDQADVRDSALMRTLLVMLLLLAAPRAVLACPSC